ncbi:YqjF family protein [Kineococcus rhizosphaerae]|uniref:DUF2071 domain-containing protein n=1 Tax=Kineococcus rhizosphaerae TaxID=559628 RepID=A0A2T0R5U2_9ACTN|nr:DUF2071 domain-containing protein [Kineococcus rhizosphaerae]PRY16133.1 hypothetical protein CLV37_104353 [Kineococcus rhizosphaerae]
MLPPPADPRSAPDLTGPVMMHQHWDDLAFLHWEADPAQVAAHLPPGTRPDLFEGRAYVGLIPFTLRGAGPGRRGPAVPYVGTFLETNVRMYSVDDEGRHGVVFASLDTSRLLAVLGAQALFGLPYRWSAMTRAVRTRGGARELGWTCRTRAGVRSRVAVREGEPFEDDLGVFLTARFGLHVAHLGRTRWVPNEHEPWPLRRAEVLDLDDGLVAAAGFDVQGPPDHVAFARRVTTRFAVPRRIGGELQSPAGR